MKRDMELVRILLMELSESDFPSDVGLPLVDGYNEDEVRRTAARECNRSAKPDGRS